MRRPTFLAVVLVLVFACGPAWAQQALPAVAPAAQTTPFPVANTGIADSAIWIHPTDVTQSLVFGVNGQNGLFTWDLDGGAVGTVIPGPFNTVDVRYQFPLPGGRTALVAAGPRDTSGTVAFFTVNPTTRALVDVTATPPLQFSGTISCLALWHPPGSADYELFLWGPQNFARWALTATDAGTVAATPLGTATSFSSTGITGCAVDEANHVVYFTISSQGLLRGQVFDDGGVGTPTLIFGSGPQTSPSLAPPVQGVGLVPLGNGGGQLLVAAPGTSGANTLFALFDRVTNAADAGAFQVASDGGIIPSVRATAGFAVTNFGLGGVFSGGLLVAHDGINDGGNPNFKLVPWSAVTAALRLPSDPGFDPRLEGFAPGTLDGGLADGGLDGGLPPGGTVGTPPGTTGPPVHLQKTGCTCQSAGAGGLFSAVLLAGWAASRRRTSRRTPSPVDG